MLPHPRAQSPNMASNPKESAFNILGSSKLNTSDGKNPVSPTSTSIQPGTASGQKNSDEYRQECNKAHDALENRLRDEVNIQFFEPSVPESCMTWSCKKQSESLVLLRPASTV